MSIHSPSGGNALSNEEIFRQQSRYESVFLHCPDDFGLFIDELDFAPLFADSPVAQVQSQKSGLVSGILKLTGHGKLWGRSDASSKAEEKQTEGTPKRSLCDWSYLREKQGDGMPSFGILLEECQAILEGKKNLAGHNETSLREHIKEGARLFVQSRQERDALNREAYDLVKDISVPETQGAFEQTQEAVRLRQILEREQEMFQNGIVRRYDQYLVEQIFHESVGHKGERIAHWVRDNMTFYFSRGEIQLQNTCFDLEAELPENDDQLKERLEAVIRESERLGGHPHYQYALLSRLGVEDSREKFSAAIEGHLEWLGGYNIDAANARNTLSSYEEILTSLDLFSGEFEDFQRRAEEGFEQCYNVFH